MRDAFPAAKLGPHKVWEFTLKCEGLVGCGLTFTRLPQSA